jgi:hypothetical protein
MVKDMDLVSVFCRKMSSFSTFFEKAVFSPLFDLGTSVKNLVGIVRWLHSVSCVLLHMSSCLFLC